MGNLIFFSGVWVAWVWGDFSCLGNGFLQLLGGFSAPLILLSAHDLGGSVPVTLFVCGWRNGRRLHLRVGQLFTDQVGTRARRTVPKGWRHSNRFRRVAGSPSLFVWRVLISSFAAVKPSSASVARPVLPPEVHGQLSGQGHGDLLFVGHFLPFASAQLLQNLLQSLPSWLESHQSPDRFHQGVSQLRVTVFVDPSLSSTAAAAVLART